MKKNLLSSAIILVAVFITAASVFAPKIMAQTSARLTASQVEVPALSDEAKPEAQKLLESRFLNMLNHNYVYNDDFQIQEDIINSSMPALLNLREGDFIDQSFVGDYIFNMYGIEITDFSEFNKDFPEMDGYVYIIPRGYTEYRHSIKTVSENEDGSFTVETEITLDSHDGASQTENCTSLFVKNESSSFGFSIIYSNISNNSSAI